MGVVASVDYDRKARSKRRRRTSERPPVRLPRMNLSAHGNEICLNFPDTHGIPRWTRVLRRPFRNLTFLLHNVANERTPMMTQIKYVTTNANKVNVRPRRVIRSTCAETCLPSEVIEEKKRLRPEPRHHAEHAVSLLRAKPSICRANGLSPMRCEHQPWRHLCKRGHAVPSHSCMCHTNPDPRMRQ